MYLSHGPHHGPVHHECNPSISKRRGRRWWILISPSSLSTPPEMSEVMPVMSISLSRIGVSKPLQARWCYAKTTPIIFRWSLHTEYPKTFNICVCASLPNTCWQVPIIDAWRQEKKLQKGLFSIYNIYSWVGSSFYDMYYCEVPKRHTPVRSDPNHLIIYWLYLWEPDSRLWLLPHVSLIPKRNLRVNQYYSFVVMCIATFGNDANSINMVVSLHCLGVYAMK